MNAQRTTTKGKTIAPPAALEGMPLEVFAPIYRGCATLGIARSEVEEMEVWEVASTLGIDMDPDDDTPGRGGDAMARTRAAALRQRGRL